MAEDRYCVASRRLFNDLSRISAIQFLSSVIYPLKYSIYFQPILTFHFFI